MHIIHRDENIMIARSRNIYAFLAAFLFIVVGIAPLVMPSLFPLITAPIQLAIVFLIAGTIVLYFFGIITTIRISRSQREVVLTWTRIWGKKSVRYDANQIHKVVCQQSRRFSTGNTAPGYAYRLKFILKDGAEVPFEQELMQIHRAFLTGRSINMMRQPGQEIATFLQIPFEEKAAPTFNEIFELAKKDAKQ